MDVPNLTLSICSFRLCFLHKLEKKFFYFFRFFAVFVRCCCLCCPHHCHRCHFFVVSFVLCEYFSPFSICYCQILILERAKNMQTHTRTAHTVLPILCSAKIASVASHWCLVPAYGCHTFGALIQKHIKKYHHITLAR